MLKELAEGTTFIHMNKLIRQPIMSSHVDDRHETKLAEGIIVTQVKRPKTRQVDNQTDWYEVMHSSILPSMAQRILESSSLDDAKAIATTLQQHICYVLRAISLFRENSHSFTQVFGYLESHREQCIKYNQNIAQPDTLTLQEFQHNVLIQKQNNVSASKSHSSSRGAPSTLSLSSKPSSGSSSTSSHGSRKKQQQYGFLHCGKFNSRNGCDYVNCTYPHICRECQSDQHNKTACPIFLKKQQGAANKSNSNNNNKSNNNNSSKK